MKLQKSKIDATAKTDTSVYVNTKVFLKNLRDCVDVCKRAPARVLVHREQQHRAGSVNKAWSQTFKRKQKNKARLRTLKENTK